MSRAPGVSVWSAVTAASSSAMVWVTVPAGVIGAVPPAMGTVKISTGTPKAAASAWKSSRRPLMRKGEATV